MAVVTIISEIFLYLCFSLLVGYFMLQLVSKGKRPEIIFPKWLRFSCIIGIMVLSFVPVLRLVLYLAPGMGLGITLTSVLTTFEIGRAWLYIVGMAMLLLIVNFAPEIDKKKSVVVVCLVYLVGLALLIGWSSHARSLTGFDGLALHSLHFTVIMLWSGILLVVGWFSKETESWFVPFLKWFTPLAIVCVVVAVGTGFLLMQLVIDLQDYSLSWLVSYGQALLFKHLLIVPLLIFAFMNGFLLRSHIKRNGSGRVLAWLRAEGVFVLLIFVATGILGQQAPPHDIMATIANEGAAKLAELLYSGTISPELRIKMELNPGVIVFGVLAIGSALMMFALFLRKKGSCYAVLFGSLFVITGYVSLMLSI